MCYLPLLSNVFRPSETIAQRESDHLSRIAVLDYEVRRLRESEALSSKVADLEHHVRVLKKSIELAHEEAKPVKAAKTQVRQKLELVQIEML